MKRIRDDYDLIMPWHVRDVRLENTYFCSWSDMDLGYYLPNECNNKNLPYANYLKWWINAQEIFYVRNFKVSVYVTCNLTNCYFVGYLWSKC